MSLPDALLGTSLKAYFNQNYTPGTGTFVDDKGNATNLVQSTSANRPTWDTSTAPSGRGILSFAGSAQVLLGGGIAPGAVGAFASFFFVEFCIIVRTSASTANSEQIVDYNGNDQLLLNFGPLVRNGSTSNSNPFPASVHYIIVVTDLSGVVTMYVDGVAQTTTGTTSGAAGGIIDQWEQTWGVGNRINATEPYAGKVGCMGWAQQATWTGTDTSNLYAAMVQWWTTGAALTPEGKLAIHPDTIARARNQAVQETDAIAAGFVPIANVAPTMPIQTRVVDYARRTWSPAAMPAFIPSNNPISSTILGPDRDLFPDRIPAPWTPAAHLASALGAVPIANVAPAGSAAMRPIYPDAIAPAQRRPPSDHVLPRLERPTALADTEFPERVPRPATLAAANHIAVTETPAQPERTAPLADFEFPDRALRPSFGAQLQLHVTELPTQPERTSPLADVSFPGAVFRPTLGAAQQLASTELPTQPERPSPLADVDYPASVFRPTLPAAHQLASTQLSPSPERTTPVADVSFPAGVLRAFYLTAEQLAATELSPFPERTAPVADVGYPAYVTRPLTLAAEQLASTELSPFPIPNLATPFYGTTFQDAVGRPVFFAASQYASNQLPSQPERTSPLAVAAYPDAISRAAIATANQLDVAELPPQPERQSPLADVIYPTFLFRAVYRLDGGASAPNLPPAGPAAPTYLRPVFDDYLRRVPLRFEPTFVVPTQLPPPNVPPQTFPVNPDIVWGPTRRADASTATPSEALPLPGLVPLPRSTSVEFVWRVVSRSESASFAPPSSAALDLAILPVVAPDALPRRPFPTEAGARWTVGVFPPFPQGSYPDALASRGFAARHQLALASPVLVAGASPIPLIPWAAYPDRLASPEFRPWRNAWISPPLALPGSPSGSTSIRWSFRPATAIVIAFRPSTDVRVRQQAVTQIIVRQTMSLQVGDTNDIDVEFRDGHTRALVDPTTVRIAVQTPTQSRATPPTSTTYTYGVDALLTKQSTGKYRASIPCTEAGTWSFAWKSPGPIAPGVEPGNFDVSSTI